MKTKELTPHAIEPIQAEKTSLHGLAHLLGPKFADVRQPDKVLANRKMLADQGRNFIMAAREIDITDYVLAGFKMSPMVLK